MADPVASTTEGSPADGKSVGLIGNLLRRVSRAEPVPDEEEEDEELPPPPPLTPRGPIKGCLTVHLKNCREFNKNSSIKKGTQGFLRMSIGEKVKCTMVQPYKDPKAERSKFPLCFNEWKYFSIQIPKSTDNTLGICESHRLVVELIFFEQDTGVPKLMGKTFVKLLDILSKSQMNHLLDLKLKCQIICKLEMEMVIAYGSLGYGYSHQLRHPKRNMESLVEHSLFLRCPPPEDRKDPHYNVVTPKPVPYSDFIAALMYRETTNPDNRKTHPSNSTISPIILECMEKRGRLLHMHEEMEAFESSEDALQYLEKLVMKKGIRTGTPWRINNRFKVLSKWRKKVTMVSKLLSFGGCSEAAKQQRDNILPTDPLGSVTPPVPLLKCLVMQQENRPLVNENNVSTTSKPPSPRKTLAAASGLSTSMAYTQAAQSAPSSPPPSDQYTILPTVAAPPKSAVAHKASPPSSVASSSMDHPAQSRATSPSRHITLVLPEDPATPASTSAQPSTRHIPKPTMVAAVPVPIHLNSPCVLTTLEEDGEEEEEEEEEAEEEEEEVHAPVSSFLLKTLPSLTLTPEVALHATLVSSHQQSRHGQLEECQPANPRYQQEECQPANPRYQKEEYQPANPGYQKEECQPANPGYQQEECQPANPRYQKEECQPANPGYQQEECQPANPGYQQEECQPANLGCQPYQKPRQKSPSRGKSDRDLGETGGVRELGWTQTQRKAAGMGSIESRWNLNFAGLGSLSFGGQCREEDAPCSSTALRSPTLNDLVPPRLLGAWTENIATVPIPIGGGVGGLDWRSGGLPAAQGTTLLSQLISPPSNLPSSCPLSHSPLTRSPLPPLGFRATDTPSPDLETSTLDSTPFLGGRLCESNPPDIHEGETSSNTDRHTQRPGGASSSTDPLTTLNSWLSSLPTGAGLDSGQWSLLSEIDMSPLRSGLVFSPLTPISSSGPLTPSPSSSPNRRTRGSKPGKERPRVLETPNSPYHRRNRDGRDYYGKM